MVLELLISAFKSIIEKIKLNCTGMYLRKPGFSLPSFAYILYTSLCVRSVRQAP